MSKQITVTAPVNIAVIKYWGKRDVKLNLPTNSSLSVTLSQDQMCSTTSVVANQKFDSNKLWLNGEENEISGRLSNVIDLMRKLTTYEELKNIPIRIASFNNFPTAAGLASSASGFAALVYALGKLFVPEYTNNQLSTIARQGSGSACRSLFGGFVAWERGEKEDGSDSNAVEVASKDYWPDIEALICVVNAGKKSVPSTAGMQRTVTTSPYLMHRAENVVPQRMKDISEAIKAKNFDRFAEITMQDSNSFHATCLDTNPPIFYLTDTSRAIINTIHMLNEAAGKNIAAYTFDAGPNAVIYTERKHTNLVLSLINELYEPSNPIDTIDKSANDLLKEHGINLNIENLIKLDKGSLTKIIKTEVGDGPKVISNDNSLLNENGELN